LLGGCWADFVPRAGRRGGHAKLGRSIGGDRADLAGVDSNGTVLHHAAAGPILTRVQILLDDTQPKISTMVSDAAHIVYLARGQAQKMDRVFTDAADRFRGQLLHIDRILTGTMEAVEDAGAQFKHSFWKPVQRASALVQGIKVGLDLLRSRRAATQPDAQERSSPEQEEELFI